MKDSVCRVVVCRGPECGEKRNSLLIYEEFRRELGTRVHEQGDVRLLWQSCFGRCTQGPNVLIQLTQKNTTTQFHFATLPSGKTGRSALYNGLQVSDVRTLIQNHIDEGKIVRALVKPATDKTAESQANTANSGGIQSSETPNKNPQK